MARVLVAMSGGVDSSVAALLMRDAGHDIAGVTLKLWGGEQDSGCCSVSDVEDARRIAAQLGIDHYVWNLTAEFEARVVASYVDAYATGSTPNPCIECNRTMKWGRLLDRALALGFDAIATGHHARVVDSPRGLRLGRGADRAKDQSYVLAKTDASGLQRTLLPIGDRSKDSVRELAESFGFRTAHKPDSQDLCFVASGSRETFLGSRIARRPGRLVDRSGNHLGDHRGVDLFTIGQRRGLGIALGERSFVVDIDATSGDVTVGARADLDVDSQPFRDPTFVSGVPPDDDVRFAVQVRAHGQPAEATLQDGRVCWSVRQPRVAPGQLLVFYCDDMVEGAAYAT